MSRKNRTIRASGRESTILLCGGSAISITAEAQQVDGKPKRKTFSMNAYNGGAMDVGWGDRVVVDLSGLTGTDKKRPALLSHDYSKVVGHIEAIRNDGKRLDASGVVSGGGEAANEVVRAAENDFPWQASVGVRPSRTEFVESNQQVQVNGQSFAGPIYVVRAGVLSEISFVPLGADDTTSARIAANAARETAMTFEQWLEARGLTAATLSAEQAASLRAQFDAEASEVKPPAKPTKKVKAAAPTKPVEEPEVEPAPTPDVLATVSEALAKERKRISDIEAACDESKFVGAPIKLAEVRAKAVAEGWDLPRTNAEILAKVRELRPTAPGYVTNRSNASTDDVMTAALCMASGLPNVEKSFTTETLEAAGRAYKHGRNASLQRVLLHAAQANGYGGSEFDRSDDGIRDILRAAFSTRNIAGVLSNTMNKFLLAGYSAVEQSWREIAATRPVNDFKTATSYRLTDDSVFEKIGPEGLIPHGSLDEASFTNRAYTYAKMFGISRTDIYNDDLGALNDIPRRLGRGGALALNTAFWTAWLADTSFFTGGNLVTQTLGYDGLTSVEATFDTVTDPQGQPLGATAAILLVPPALSTLAMQLMNSQLLITGADATMPAANVHAGKYKVVKSRYLTDTNAWYLLASPADIAGIEVAFLNNVQTPTVQVADADFNQLGIQYRGYFDFGVALQDSRCGIKSNPS